MMMENVQYCHKLMTWQLASVASSEASSSVYSYSPPFAVHLHMHAKITLTLDSYHRKFSPPKDIALFIQLSPCFCTQLA